MAVLVDSSVWIAADKKKSAQYAHLKKIIDHNEIQLVICRVIQVEVCQGAKSQVEFALLWEAFLGFQCLEVSPDIWQESAWNYFRCRQKGLTFSTIDVLIGTLAQHFRLRLWTMDKAFRKMKEVIGFDLYEPE